MNAISELLSGLFDLVPLGIVGAVLGIFLFAVGTFIEAKTTNKFGRTTMVLGFLILGAVAYDFVT